MNDFMGHRESIIDCTLFNSALIVGKDRNDPRKSNGVGKSSVFKAIDYVLYNIASTKTLDKIIRDGAKKCQVSLDFESNKQIYRVVRSRSIKGASDLRLYREVSGKWTDISEKTNTETEKSLHDLIKISYKAFKSCILFAQGDLEGLASASPTERKALLKEPLQITVYNKYEKLAKIKSNKALKDIEHNESLIEYLGNPLVDIISFESQINELISEINSDTSLREAKQIELDQRKTELHDLQRMITSEASDIRKKLSDISKEKNILEKQINKLDLYIIERNKKLKKSELDLNANKKELNTLESNLESLVSKQVRTKEEINKDLENVKENERRGQIHIARLQAEFNRYNEPIPNDSTCNNCRQDITSSHRAICEKESEEKCKQIQKQIDDYNKKLKVVIDKKKKLNLELENLSQHFIKIDSFGSKIENKKNEIIKNNELILEFESLIISSEKEKKDSNNSLNALKKRESSLKEALENFSIDDINNKIDIVKKEISGLEAAINKLLQLISSNNTLLGVVKEKKRTRTADSEKLDKLEKEKEVIEYNYSIQRKVVQAFSSAGIPTLIIHTILDDLQLEANNILSELRPGIELQFHISKNEKDTLDLNYKINGRERDWDQLGGGQKVFIALSLKLGLSIVVQRRLGVDIKFLELDEVDQPLDKAGVDAYADVIKKWQNKFKVMVVTHNSDLKNKFSHAILVESDGDNGSIAKVVDNW